MSFVIYVIQNKIDGKVYVGQTSRPGLARWKEHKCYARQGRESHLYSALRKYGEDQFAIRELASTEDKVQADALEHLWIICLDACNHDVGYNLTYSGSVVLATPETRAKLSRSLKGKKAWNKGLTASLETRRRMSNTHKQRWISIRKGL